jgi:hypothetical protein
MSELVADNNQTDTRLGQARPLSDCPVSNLPARLMTPPVPKTSSWTRTTSAATRPVDKTQLTALEYIPRTRRTSAAVPTTTSIERVPASLGKVARTEHSEGHIQ